MPNYNADRNQFSTSIHIAQFLMDAGILNEGFDVVRAVRIEDDAYVAEVHVERSIDGYIFDEWVVWDVVTADDGGAYLGGYFTEESDARVEYFARAERRARR